LKIKQKGDTVVINTLPDVQISDYTVNSEINWQLMQKGRVDLKIDRAGYYAGYAPGVRWPRRGSAVSSGASMMMPSAKET